MKLRERARNENESKRSRDPCMQQVRFNSRDHLVLRPQLEEFPFGQQRIAPSCNPERSSTMHMLPSHPSDQDPLLLPSCVRFLLRSKHRTSAIAFRMYAYSLPCILKFSALRAKPANGLISVHIARANPEVRIIIFNKMVSGRSIYI